MTDKYKIYIPVSVAQRLEADALFFEFLKSDGSANLNLFLKTVLVNYFSLYHEKFICTQETVKSFIASSGTSVATSDLDAVADQIIDYFRDGSLKSKETVAITLTVSRDAMDIVNQIEDSLLIRKSMSQYLGDLYVSYLEHPRYVRERIVFQETYNTLEKAIKKKEIITFRSTSAEGFVFRVEPYLIAPAKEENCGYLLCVDAATRKPQSFRISRMRSTFSEREKFTVSLDMTKKLKDVAKHNPHMTNESIDAEVFLTPAGIRAYRLIVKDRPVIVSQENSNDGKICHFHCPAPMLLNYFKRLGKDAVILSPADIKENMRTYYDEALRAYEK